MTNDLTGKKVELGFIYCLKNPDTDEIFYIGATEQSPKDRLKGHYTHFKEYLNGTRNKTRKFEYFEKIYPELAKVETLKIVTNDYLYQIEIDTIAEYSMKYELTNQTYGGEGGDTFTLQSYVDKLEISRLIQEKACGKPKPEGFGENLSKARMGANNPMAGTSRMPPVVGFKIGEEDKPIKLFIAPFEITAFLDEIYGIENHKKHAGRAGNVSKVIRLGQGKSNTSGYTFIAFDKCSKEIQDIVRQNNESYS